MNFVDNYLVYTFVQRLTTPFDQWDAFRTGVIDADGNILVPKNKRTQEQTQSFSLFDVLVRNIKLMLAKLPGGTSRFMSYGAALYFLREEAQPIADAAFFAFIEENSQIIENFVKEDAPVNNIGDGHVDDGQGWYDGLQDYPNKKKKPTEIVFNNKDQLKNFEKVAQQSGENDPVLLRRAEVND